jgi:hypothetical protein
MNDQNTLKGKIKISPIGEVEAPIRFQMDKFLPSVVAQHIAVQITTGNVLVSFFEVNPPVMFNPTPDSIEKLQQEGLPVECVARISIPVSLFPGFADVFSKVAEHIRSNENGSQDASPE